MDPPFNWMNEICFTVATDVQLTKEMNKIQIYGQYKIPILFKYWYIKYMKHNIGHF